ncbi:uncharacterized protein LOC132556265 [Ylistrum balloti]|uniref:uncharacterized protein LOC132556265 n=1 Tax=Ylistrum balloti TaxID=509963 RepID=UPI002905F7AA|nr:uncharacterized protein LOC132556265 [Ylistrum balloti]
MLRWKVNVVKKSQDRVTADFTWSTQSFTLQGIKERFKLPCVVRCCYESCPVDWEDFHFDLSQPLLLHSFRRVQKLRVRCVHKNASGQSQEFGPVLVIPEDYDGWFYIMKSDEAQPKVHKTVASLAGGPVKFYVASSLSYLALNEEPGKKKPHTIDSRHMEAGEILEGSQTAGTATIRKMLKVDTEKMLREKFLICNDEKDDKMILPLSKNGKFYEIACESEGFMDSDGLRRISYIISKKDNFPFKIRHIIGELPSLSSCYRNVLQCLDVIEEETVLASTLDKMTMIPLELQLDSPFKFKMGLNESQLRKSDNYLEALHMCETDGEAYVRGIKLTFTISPASSLISSTTSIESDGSLMSQSKLPGTLEKDSMDVSLRKHRALPMETFEGSDPSQQERASYAETATSLDDVPSCYDTGSEIEEEDAQSEFMFKWAPPENVKRLSSKKKTLEKIPVPPKVFNSSINKINSPKSSVEENIHVVWNEQPDVV